MNLLNWRDGEDNGHDSAGSEKDRGTLRTPIKGNQELGWRFLSFVSTISWEISMLWFTYGTYFAKRFGSSSLAFLEWKDLLNDIWACVDFQKRMRNDQRRIERSKRGEVVDLSSISCKESLCGSAVWGRERGGMIWEWCAWERGEGGKLHWGLDWWTWVEWKRGGVAGKEAWEYRESTLWDCKVEEERDAELGVGEYEAADVSQLVMCGIPIILQGDSQNVVRSE